MDDNELPGMWELSDLSGGESDGFVRRPSAAISQGFDRAPGNEVSIVTKQRPDPDKDSTMGTDVVKWADKAMFVAKPHDADDDLGVMPSVRLMSMTPDPLGTIASVLSLAKGEVRAPSSFSVDEKMYYWDQSSATHLRAPWEFIEFHFLIDGVPRSFTQQLERQRTATYFEQSLRFAVVEDLPRAVALPASLMGTIRRADPTAPEPLEDWATEDRHRQRQRDIWERALREVQSAYETLINLGMPAEEARGLLPLGVCTRVHYRTSLRGLSEHAGNRLCTQAQWIWKFVFNEIIRSIREYGIHSASGIENKWQYSVLAESDIFKPVCYSLGRCPWGSDFDRGCRIRPSVEAFASRGIPSPEWGNTRIEEGDGSVFGPILSEHWMAEDAARFKR